MAQLDPGISLVTFKSCTFNIPSCALPNVPMSKDHTDAGTENISVLGNYPVPKVIDLLDKELLLIYLKFNNLQMKLLLRMAQHKHNLPVKRSLAHPMCGLKYPSSSNPGHFKKYLRLVSPQGSSAKEVQEEKNNAFFLALGDLLKKPQSFFSFTVSVRIQHRHR